ncbi:hypothetical protein BDF20DRAFT_917850 [Mycotypha africana]|uniref:uncharacterized protein n=1 Tax=Mycotypha africana TaxID=64632 RepID=UPI0023015C5D|nr:uncharacterized protein BDF20DRAFT_917850 [Mycotypha africana]KAI8967191.1 hypothetical protein BDF20DRAFT_917850 [Mycotypha africana]
MDMSHMDMNSQATPPNINEPYAKTLITIITAVIAFLTLRHVVRALYKIANSISSLKKIHHSFIPAARYYQRIETLVVNRFGYKATAYGPPLGALLLILALASAILPLLLINVDLKLNSNRAGFLALALVPFLLSSTGKNSALSLLTGISPLKLNFLHRILGWALFICATVHMAFMIHAWSKFPTFLQSELQLPKVQYGLAGYGCLCVVIAGSLWPVRVFCYEAFLMTHLLGFAFIGLIAVHTPYAMRYFFTGIVCYGLNVVAVWFVKSYIATARFEVLPGGCTKVFIRLASPIKQHQVGQYIMLCIPAISPFQWHPFTITNVHVSEQQPIGSAFQNTLEVCVCVRGNYTRKLYNIVSNHKSQEMRVFVSGPFGSSGIEPRKLLERSTSIIIASGGAGITFGMRLLRELMDALAADEDTKVESRLLAGQQWCKTEDIYFYWSVRRPIELSWFRTELEQINHYAHHQKNMQHQFPRVHVKFYITSASNTTTGDSPSSLVTIPQSTTAVTPSVSSGIINEDIGTDEIEMLYFSSNNENAQQSNYSKSIDTIVGQRIQAKDILEHAHDDTASLFVCGPKQFNSMISNAVAIHSSAVSLHCEKFE